jgi:hypothetical protein
MHRVSLRPRRCLIGVLVIAAQLAGGGGRRKRLLAARQSLVRVAGGWRAGAEGWLEEEKDSRGLSGPFCPFGFFPF